MLTLALFLLFTSNPLVQSRTIDIFAEKSEVEAEAALSFKLIHINDIHAHFEQVNVNTGKIN